MATIRKVVPAAAIAAVVALFWFYARAGGASPAVVVPAPAVDIPRAAAAEPGRQTVVLAGGCFWGVEAVFQAREGRHRGDVGLRGRLVRDRAVRAGQRRAHRARRVGARDVRSGAGVAGPAAAGLLLGRARSDAGEPAGPRQRGRSTARRSSSAARRRSASSTRTSRSLKRRRCFRGASRPRSRRWRRSTRRRPTTRTTRRCTRTKPVHRDHDAPKVVHLRELFPALYRAS